jgi:Na+/proline symporter
MRPLVVLLGIVMGSTVSIAVALLLTGVVFLLLPEYSERLADEHRPLMVACLLSVVLAGVAIASFYGELRTRAWRLAAHAGLVAMLAIALWTYWPRR